MVSWKDWFWSWFGYNDKIVNRPEVLSMFHGILMPDGKFISCFTDWNEYEEEDENRNDFSDKFDFFVNEEKENFDFGSFVVVNPDINLFLDSEFETTNIITLIDENLLLTNAEKEKILWTLKFYKKEHNIIFGLRTNFRYIFVAVYYKESPIRLRFNSKLSNSAKDNE